MRYKGIVFDMDNTVSESRMPIDSEMAELLAQLLNSAFVGVISGGTFAQFNAQVVSKLPETARISSLFLFVTSGTQLLRFKDGEWKHEYNLSLSPEEKKAVFDALSKVLNIPDSDVTKFAEDRDGQITYSALGKDAPRKEKDVWDTDKTKRLAIIDQLRPLLPHIQITIGGTTSIDFTKKGIDKAFGVQKFMEMTKSTFKDILYVGDALFPGGNDAAVLRLPIEAQLTSGPEETKNIIKGILGLPGY
jgi:phosphomannomutase